MAVRHTECQTNPLAPQMGRHSAIVGLNTYSVQQPRHAEGERKVPAKIAEPGEDTRECLNDRMATSITARLNYDTHLCPRTQLCSLVARSMSASTKSFTALRPSIDVLAPRPCGTTHAGRADGSRCGRVLVQPFASSILHCPGKDLADGTRGAALLPHCPGNGLVDGIDGRAELTKIVAVRHPSAKNSSKKRCCWRPTWVDAVLLSVLNTNSVQQPRHAEGEGKVPAKITEPGENTRECFNDRLATSITARLNCDAPLCPRAQLCSLAARSMSASTKAFTELRPSIDVLAPRPLALPTPAELTVASAFACLHNHLLRPLCIVLATARLTARAVPFLIPHCPGNGLVDGFDGRAELTNIVVVRHPECQELVEEAMLLAPQMGRRSPAFDFEYELSATTAAR